MVDVRRALLRLARQVRARLRERPLESAVQSALLLVLVVQAALRWEECGQRGIHWDEFNFLRIVHAAHRGEPVPHFQTFHARLFFWLPQLGGNEVDQIIVAREVIWLGNLFALGALALVGRRLLGWTASLWALCLVGSASYVIQHACSFRYDGLILPLYAGSLWLLSRGSRAAASLAGAMLGLAMMISLKAALFGLPLAVFALLGRGDDVGPKTLRYLLRYALWAAASFGLLALLHWAVLAGHGQSQSRALGDYAEGMFAWNMPRRSEISRSVRSDSGVWFFLLAGGALLLGGTSWLKGSARHRIMLAFFAGSPLLCLAVYRNAWPYFISGVLIMAAPWIATVPALLLRAGHIFPVPLVFLSLLGSGVYSGMITYSWHLGSDDDVIGQQRQVIATTKAIFPKPVPYVDRCGMIASYPKVGPFITSLTTQRYQAAGKPVFETLLRESQPPLLLANVGGLDVSGNWHRGSHSLLKADFQTLKSNFVPFWGPVWVAGKDLQLEAEREQEIEMLISGRYTLEADQPLTLDHSIVVEPGRAIQLEQGIHTIVAGHGGSARLRFGEALTLPTRAPPSKWLFEGTPARQPLFSWL